MAVDISGWGSTESASLESRFFVDDGLWRDAPLLTGHGSFAPLPEVKNILVTGGEGFIASWLVRHLVSKYPEAYNVISFDKMDYCSSRNNSRMLEGRPNFQFFHGDVTKPADVLKCLRKFNIDTIFHLAARTHVDLSFGNSFDFSINNYFGTHVLLNCAVLVGAVKRFYHISTDEVYGEVGIGDDDLKEQSRLDPTNPYAASKTAAENMVLAYVKSFKLPVVIVRLNNVYGPHQYPESTLLRLVSSIHTNEALEIIPKFLSLLQRRMPLFLHGDGQHTRRYLYAGDAADAFDTILHKGEIGQTYNVDSRDELSNIEVAKKLLGMFGLDDTEHWIQYTRDRHFNDRRYAVDGAKLRKLGWRQRVSLEEGLAAAKDWYSKFSAWWGPIDNTLLSAFPVVCGDHVIAPEAGQDPGKDTKLEKAIALDGDGNIEEHSEVGAFDDRACNEMNGFVSNGITGSRKRRRSELLVQLSELVAELTVAD